MKTRKFLTSGLVNVQGGYTQPIPNRVDGALRGRLSVLSLTYQGLLTSPSRIHQFLLVGPLGLSITVFLLNLHHVSCLLVKEGNGGFGSEIIEVEYVNYNYKS